MYAKSRRDSWFEMRISNHGPEVFLSYASRKSRSEIAVWMTWPLNRVLGGGASVTFWPLPPYIPQTAYVQKHRKCEFHACLIGRVVGTQTFFSRWNAKSKTWSLMCTLRNSKFAITSIVCTLRNSRCASRITIQNTHFAAVWKQSRSPWS